MTEQELKGVAFQALNLARADRTTRGWKTSIVLAIYYKTDKTPLTRMESVEELLLEKLGKGWLSDGRKKDMAFQLLRRAIDKFPKTPDAVIIVTPADMYMPTAKMLELSMEEQKRLADLGASARPRLVREGLYDVIDSYTALAQTPELVMTVNQAADDETAPVTRCGPLNSLTGRLKMFGGEDQENAQA